MIVSTHLARHAYRIYVVEDSAILLRLLLEMLGGIDGASIVGYSGSADEAVSEIADSAPDAVIVDLMLQSGTGYDVLSALAREGKRPPLAIVLTNFAMFPHRERSTELGAAYFFDKSTEIVEMFRVMNRLVEEHSRLAMAQSPAQNRT